MKFGLILPYEKGKIRNEQIMKQYVSYVSYNEKQASDCSEYIDASQVVNLYSWADLTIFTKLGTSVSSVSSRLSTLTLVENNFIKMSDRYFTKNINVKEAKFITKNAWDCQFWEDL